MDESLDAILDTSKGPEWRYFCNHLGDHLARRIALFYCCPGINLSAFDRQRNFLLLFINAKHLDFDLLADLEHFARMVDAAPGELADMHQSVCASQVNKGPKIREVTDDTTTYFTWFQLVK